MAAKDRFAPSNSIAHLGTSRDANDKCAEVIAKWHAGEQPDAVGVLLERSSWLADRSIVFDLALVEYRLRREREPNLSPSDFRERFEPLGAGLADSIECLVAMEAAFDQSEVDLPEFDWPLPGDEIGHFRVAKELGRGGLARVYRCIEPAVGSRDVVVKVTAKPTGEEAILGGLDDRWIVPIYSVSECLSTGGRLICMPYRGELTLDGLIARTARRGRKCDAEAVEAALRESRGAASEPVEETFVSGCRRWESVALSILAGVASGIENAHRNGVIHGDIKPANVLVTTAGPLLIDFNLARRIERADACVSGTVPYLAPEVVQAIAAGRFVELQPVGQPCDVYSFGLLAAELVVGEPPLDTGAGIGSLEPNDVWQSQAALVSAAVERLGRRRDLARLIRDCCVEDPARRPRVHDALRRLEAAAHVVSRRTIAAGIAGATMLAASPLMAGSDPTLDGAVATARRGDLVQAAADLRWVSRRSPRSVAARYSLVHVLVELGDLELVWPELEELRSLRVDDQIRSLHGYASVMDERYGAALAWYSEMEGSLRYSKSVRNNHAVALWLGRGRLSVGDALNEAASLLWLATDEEGALDVRVARNFIGVEAARLVRGQEALSPFAKALPRHLREASLDAEDIDLADRMTTLLASYPGDSPHAAAEVGRSARRGGLGPNALNPLNVRPGIVPPPMCYRDEHVA